MEEPSSNQKEELKEVNTNQFNIAQSSLSRNSSFKDDSIHIKQQEKHLQSASFGLEGGKLKQFTVKKRSSKDRDSRLPSLQLQVMDMI
mmetsp:Transcript_33387/g.32448  ORF Transcript_33387/g.32448 Transcript_33387/m.32448 type:complete len:88 (+) Transcript_33387:131-394(+)